MNDAVGHLGEEATYCKVGDDKRPQLVGLPDFTTREICPEKLSEGADELVNAWPDGWYVRIMFDELLDPSIEELTEIKDEDGMGTDTFTGSIKKSRPVKLECESIGGGFVEVPYDGYYSPSGNAVTWPLGPSLVIIPDAPKTVATNKQCRVTINDNVTDKSGMKVPDADRAPGRFTFRIAPIQVIAIDPPDDPMGKTPIDALQVFSDNIYVQFNTFVDAASFCDEGATMDQCEFTFSPDIGACSISGNPCEVGKTPSGCPGAEVCESGGFYAYSLAPFGFTETEFGFGPNLPVQVDKSYTFSFLAGGKIKDRCGVETTLPAPSVENHTLIHYKTKPFAVKAFNIGAGDLASPMKKLDLPFTNVVDVTTLDATEYTLTPAPLNPSLTSPAGGDIMFAGDYALDTMYTFTLKAGAKIADVYGAETTIAADKVVTWKTQPAVTLATTADNASVTRNTVPATPPAVSTTTAITLTWNQSMDRTTFVDGTDYTLTNSGGATVPSTISLGSTASSQCNATSTSCQFRVRVATSDLPAGNYKFTLKAGAAVSGIAGLTANFTQPADKVINIVVKEPAPATPPIVCL
ncbi:MAG: hypothetical protein H0T46_18850 [Deltaproteobacteria bacterium]|nr:hypothetical protein [Deltaproteobacteria bacterium]